MRFQSYGDLRWIKVLGAACGSFSPMSPEFQATPTEETPTEETVREALRSVDDPEAGMNIVELGLVYGIDVEADRVRVRMTMTSAACPMGDYLTEAARDAVLRAYPQLGLVDVELVWEPMWTPEMMSEEARNFFGWQ